MRPKSIAVQMLSVATLVATFLPPGPVLGQTLPYYEVTGNGTWDCRDPAGAYKGTIVLAEETYALLEADGRLHGYGKLRLLSADTHLPNFAVLGGPLKDEFGSGAVAVTGPREDYENFSGELFLAVAVSTDRRESWYCTGRHAPQELK